MTEAENTERQMAADRMLESLLRFTMSKVILAEYDAEHQALKLPEPLDGVKDRERVRVAIEKEPLEAVAELPWLSCEGSIDPESGRQIATAIQEAFGRGEIEV